VNGGKGNWAFWARIAGAKFTSCAETDAPYIPYEGYPYAPLDPSHFSLESDRAHADQSRTNTKGGNTLAYRAFTLRTRSLALSLIRQGDPHAPGAGRALRVAWGMLLEDGGEGERLDFSKVDVALGRSTSGMGMSTHLILLRSSFFGVSCMLITFSFFFPFFLIASATAIHAGDQDEGERSMRGKNRRQLASARARDFAWRYVRERMYEGRFGDDSSEVILFMSFFVAWAFLGISWCWLGAG
jgi:hypothetical protein